MKITKVNNSFPFASLQNTS
uniref:Uncharacterized protein n=1 Tax=Anguilla anguilla TaxID=7936 RepID=A0A0E9P6J9_ANGAN